MLSLSFASLFILAPHLKLYCHSGMGYEINEGISLGVGFGTGAGSQASQEGVAGFEDRFLIQLMIISCCSSFRTGVEERLTAAYSDTLRKLIAEGFHTRESRVVVECHNWSFKLQVTRQLEGCFEGIIRVIRFRNDLGHILENVLSSPIMGPTGELRSDAQQGSDSGEKGDK